MILNEEAPTMVGGDGILSFMRRGKRCKRFGALLSFQVSQIIYLKKRIINYRYSLLIVNKTEALNFFMNHHQVNDADLLSPSDCLSSEDN